MTHPNSELKTSTLIKEDFNRQTLDPRLQWLNPPLAWEIDHARSRLLLKPNANTDFWQQTHYGFRAENGHFLYAESAGDATLTAGIRLHPAHQYDQAGLMVRFSADCWLKASNEFEPEGPSHLGAVVTNFGFSDWSLQNFPYGEEYAYCLRIRREGWDLLVEHARTERGPWNLMRIAHMHSASGPIAQMGIYACSPQEDGCLVEIEFLHLEMP